jgi:hypothetical protein
MATWARLHRELRRLRDACSAGAVGPSDRLRFAWYAEGCPCELPAGACTVHPRARPGQRPPEGDWRVFLLLGGRGAGKTRTAAELVRHWVESGSARRIGLIGADPPPMCGTR